MEWQPIETAPTDGTPVLAWRAGWRRPRHVEWCTDDPPGDAPCWVDDELDEDCALRGDDEPTHWLPLPPVPAGTEG